MNRRRQSNNIFSIGH